MVGGVVGGDEVGAGAAGGVAAGFAGAGCAGDFEVGVVGFAGFSVLGGLASLPGSALAQSQTGGGVPTVLEITQSAQSGGGGRA